MAKKYYYIVESQFCCFGGVGSCRRVAGYCTNKKEAQKIINALRKQADKHKSYWIDFAWEPPVLSDLLTVAENMVNNDAPANFQADYIRLRQAIADMQ
jgi:hypothetical protein